MAVVITLIGAGSGGCAHTEMVYVSERLSLPVRPILPSLSSDDLQCLSDDAYRRLVERNRLRREYAEEMEVIIKSTWPRDSPEK
ncbi:MAG: hypothetical protein OEX12_15080 [Gammaproteobacteria bacterium]|nr:hypothetical protein [Gammaproteobacteria bacterium]